MKLLQDKVVVAGIGPGLGRSIAIRSAEHGAHVVLAARTDSRLEEVAKEVTALGCEALSVPTDMTDISDPDAAKRLVDATAGTFGRADALVHNALAMPPIKDRGVQAQVVYDETAANTDLRRLPLPDEVTDAVVFLSSPMARAITGQCLDVNCGECHH